MSLYIPEPGFVGTQLLKAAIADYLAQDDYLLTLLPNGKDSIMDEGSYSDQTLTPAVIFTSLGDGETQGGIDNQIIRLILYVLDRGRGFFYIEQVIERMRKLLNADEVFEFLSFPPDVDLMVLNVRARAATSTATSPRHNAEGKGLYVFINVAGVPASD